MTQKELLQAATSQNFSVPTPPYADGTWEMYSDFVGGLQFWGYALASGSGDGGVRMWDRKSSSHTCTTRLKNEELSSTTGVTLVR
jgi:division protein 1